MTADPTLECWLDNTSELRARLLSYSRSAIPNDPGARQIDVSKALELGQEAGDLLADADVFLSQAFAAAVLEARKDLDASTARAVAKGKVADIQRLRDGISVIYSTIKDRKYALMNLNRS